MGKCTCTLNMLHKYNEKLHWCWYVSVHSTCYTNVMLPLITYGEYLLISPRLALAENINYNIMSAVIEANVP